MGKSNVALLGLAGIGLGVYFISKGASGQPQESNLKGKIDWADILISTSLILRANISVSNIGTETGKFAVWMDVKEVAEDGKLLPVVTSKVLPVVELASGESDIVGKDINLAPLPTSTGWFITVSLVDDSTNTVLDQITTNKPRP